ncbi:ABC transporter permease/M1 family aminopeptidase [Polaribacter ponticola]|uniref:M1 family aminopeptidase n=1 Tax=Polaribacter ponticola TaxID=2978475 RepID=A0ABT5S6F9_9FLAO|nr:M1 family aminopeptidase [Polaribacter sp. MSW5]MDD7913694.1 M1 family aminopeptidase [Polaribacter sp. MSW5]
MFNKLLQFEVFYQKKQRAFPLLALLFLALGIFVGRQGYAPQGINFNAPFQVFYHTSIFTLGSLFVIMFFTISTMLRDKQHKMEGLIYSSSIKKGQYFWSRFLGAFIFSLLAFSPFLIGHIFGVYTADLEPERIANFQIMNYLQPWLYIVVPNVFVCTSIVFSVSTLTKNSTATYVSAVFVYIIYFVSSIFFNSPLLAQATPSSPESMVMAAIADPFGIIAYIEQTQFWTPYQKNTQLLSFSGLFFWNRLIWVGIAFGILLGTFKLFSFRKMTKKVKKEKKIAVSKSPLFSYKPLEVASNFEAQKAAFLSLVKVELKSVFKSLPFIAVLLMWVFIVFSELYSTLINGGEYGVSIYPFTNQLISLIVDPLTIFSLILIIFYSSEIVWKERSLNFNLIIDATPVKNSIFFLSKFSALILLPIILITVGILMCIMFQIALGYSNFEFDLYASFYYHYGLQLIIFCMIALFVNSLAKTKYLGMGIFGLLVVVIFKSDVLLGLQHPLTSLGFLPRIRSNNMDGFNGVSNLYNHLAMYWLAFGLLLTVFSFKIWNRGIVASFSVKIKQLLTNWSKVQKMSLSFLTILFIGFGSLVFYNVNVVSEYNTINDHLEFSENYERKFKQYESIERLYPSSKKTEVSIFPEERSYTVNAKYVMVNRSEKPMKQVFITERKALDTVFIENADLIKQDTDFGIYLFKFKKALQPQDSVMFNFKLTNKVKGYENDKSIINNGTYLNRFSNFDPILGYSTSFEISNQRERKKRNLPKRIKENESTDAHIAFEDVKYEKINFETIISTSNDQTAISSGKLLKHWIANNRNYFHYKSSKKISPSVGYFSAKYATKKTNYKGVAIEQYYDENHNFNIGDIEQSIKETLDYCQENFGRYQFDYLRIAEVPAHWPFGGFAHPGVISMVEDRLYLSDVSDEDTFNVVAKRTIHEVAHQWWGHTLSAKPVAGGSFLVEGLAKYTEAVVMEKMYGKSALYTLAENARSRYFSGRSFASKIEPAVYKVDGQSFISYGKALNVLLALRDLVGEKQVNLVLKTLTDNHRNSTKLEATTLDLLKEVYKITPKNQHGLINDWFKKVITYDVGIENARTKALANGTYEVTVKVKSKRFETLKNGEIKQISIDEHIKIGLFTAHPSNVKDDSSVLYYESNQINKEITEIKIIVKEKPNYIAIDPYGTRSDENLVDNIFQL